MAAAYGQQAAGDRRRAAHDARRRRQLHGGAAPAGMGLAVRPHPRAALQRHGHGTPRGGRRGVSRGGRHIHSHRHPTTGGGTARRAAAAPIRGHRVLPRPAGRGQRHGDGGRTAPGALYAQRPAGVQHHRERGHGGVGHPADGRRRRGAAGVRHGGLHPRHGDAHHGDPMPADAHRPAEQQPHRPVCVAFLRRRPGGMRPPRLQDFRPCRRAALLRGLRGERRHAPGMGGRRRRLDRGRLLPGQPGPDAEGRRHSHHAPAGRRHPRHLLPRILRRRQRPPRRGSPQHAIRPHNTHRHHQRQRHLEALRGARRRRRGPLPVADGISGVERRHAEPAHRSHRQRHGQRHQPDVGTCGVDVPRRRQRHGGIRTADGQRQRLQRRQRHHPARRQRLDAQRSAARLALCRAHSAPRRRRRGGLQPHHTAVLHIDATAHGALLPELRRPGGGRLPRGVATAVAGRHLPHSEQPAQPLRRTLPALRSAPRAAHGGHTARRRRMPPGTHAGLLGQHDGRRDGGTPAGRLRDRRHRRLLLRGRGHHDLQHRRQLEAPHRAPRQRAGAHGADAMHRRRAGDHIPREPLRGALRGL